MSVSDREESLEESEELIEDKPQDSESSSDHRISTTINESSEEETEVRVGLNKKSLQVVGFFGCEERSRGRIDNSLPHLSLLATTTARYSLARSLCFVLA